MFQSLKSYIRSIAASTYHAANYPLSRLKGKVVVLMYRRVLLEKDIAHQFVEPGMYVKRDVFEMHVKYLKEHFHILQLSDLLDLWTEEAVKETERYCVITFDGGWLDNYLHALPILKKYNIPATIFLPTDLVGMDRRSRPDKIGSIHFKAGERIFLNWKEVEEMSQYGISFGSYSSSHKILTGLNIEEICMEAEKSLQVLKDKAINHVPVFCYPNGAYNEEIAERIKGAGFNAAISSTAFGIEGRFPSDMFGIKRVGIHNDITFSEPLFSMRISGLGRFGL